MKKYTILKQAVPLLLLFMCFNSFSQIIETQIENVLYLGNPISNCSPINLNSNSTHNITFTVKVDALSNTNSPYAYTNGRLKIILGGYSEDIIRDYDIDQYDWTYNDGRAYYSVPVSISLLSEGFSGPNSGIIYAEYQVDNNGFIDASCNYNITLPKFSISPLSRTISCGDTSIKTFTVSNDNSSPGVLTYNWQVGSGWKRNGNVVTNFTTTTNTVDLTAYIYPPGNVSVKPTLGGVILSQLTSTVSGLNAFDPTYQLNGPNQICANTSYSLNVPSNITISDWTSSNTSVATVTSNGNQATLHIVGNGLVNLQATVTNSCEQNAIISKNGIIVGKPAIVNHTINGGFGNMSVNSTSNLSVNAVAGATQYYWTITPSTTCSAGSGPRFSANNSTTFTTTSTSALIKWNDCIGDYAVVCYAKNSCGQSYIATKWVNVFDSSNNPCRTIPPKIKVVPNPIKQGSLTLYKEAPVDPCERSSVKTDKALKIENDVKIYDLYGKLVYNRFFNSEVMTISDLKLNSGNYILNVISSNGEVLRQLIIVE